MQFQETIAHGVQAVTEDMALPAFSQWFLEQTHAYLAETVRETQAQPEDVRRSLLAMARRLWTNVPVPANHWRMNHAVKLDRNDICYCGSGKKFKHCCTQYANLPNIMEPYQAFAAAMVTLKPGQIQVADLKLIPPVALSMAAEQLRPLWGAAAVVDLLEPLFLQPKLLDARYEETLDELFDCLLESGQERRRESLVQTLLQCTDKTLAITVRGRYVSMLADRGQYDQAWGVFHEAQRINPNAPELLHLELVTLLSQGRAQEAQLRGPLLGAKARKLGFAELGQVLEAMAQNGLKAMYGQPPKNEQLDDLELEWLDLLNAIPKQLDPALALGMYTCTRIDNGTSTDAPHLEIRPGKELTALQKKWSKLFPVELPMMTDLSGDPSSLLDEPDEAALFLSKNPGAAYSIAVLDSLLLAAHEMLDDSQAISLREAANALAAHAVALCRCLAGDQPCLMPWAEMDNRPFLRILAQAINLQREANDLDAADGLMHWCLQLNPNDNQGWRQPMVHRYVETGKLPEALQLLDKYPGDMPPSGHNRALVLYAMGQAEKAEQILKVAHAQSPRILDSLLPDVVDRPPPDDGPGLKLGGETEAYYYRADMRAAWVRTGALAWARQLALPAPKPSKKAPAPNSKAIAKKQGTNLVPRPTDWGDKDRQLLQTMFTDYELLCGYITAVAWSPGVLVPNTWLPSVLQWYNPKEGQGVQDIDAMNTVLGAVMGLYNHLNNDVLIAAGQSGSPIGPIVQALHLDQPGGERRCVAWATGFAQAAQLAAAQWRRVGLPVNNAKPPFAQIYALAGRASLDSKGQPLLAGLNLPVPDAQDLLATALQTMWNVIGPFRKNQAGL